MLPIREYGYDERLAEEVCAATGCEDPAAGALLVEQAALAHPDAPTQRPGLSPSPPTKAANQVRQLMAEIAPEDGLQAILTAELVGSHCLAMNVLKGVQEAGGEDPNHPGYRVAERLLRLTARQAEVLGNLRRGGRQEVVIRREVVTTQQDQNGREVVDRRSVEARGGRRQEDPGGG